MRIREDSPFYGISEEQKEMFMDEAEQLSYCRIAELWEMRSGKTTSEGQVKRFLQRLRYERAIRETDDSQEDWKAFSERARDGKARDGLIEAARQKLLEEALANGNSALLLELYKAANEERAKEREVVVAQRRAAVAEENAMIGWSKVPGGRPAMMKRLARAEVTASLVGEVIEGEHENVIEGSKVRAMLMDSNRTAEERIAAALECLRDEGQKLLTHSQGGGGEECAKLEPDGPGAKAAANINWDAPRKEAAEMLQRLNRKAEERQKAREGKGTEGT